MQYTNLGGYSGCKVFLCEKAKDKVFVRKISSDLNYNNRLINQMKKQEEYKSEFLKTPKILNKGFTEDGLFFFDMEFVRGITLAEYIKNIEIGKIKNLIELLTGELLEIKDLNSNERIFQEKINLLKEKLIHLKNPIIDEAIFMLEEHNWNYFQINRCHGDLTFENIIIKDDKLYLIDFLDSFYESKLLDIATLLQDALIMWSYRGQEEINENLIIRLVLFKDLLIDKLKNKMGDKYLEIYYALLLKLIRIYPYIKDNLTLNFLNQKTKMLIELILKEEGGKR